MFKIYVKPTNPYTQAWHFHSEQGNLADALRLVGMIEAEINHPPHAIKIERHGDLIFNWTRSSNAWDEIALKVLAQHEQIEAMIEQTQTELG